MTEVLVLSPAPTPASGPVVDAARRRGMVVGDVGTPGRRYYFGGPLYADHVGDALGVALLEPPDTWLDGVPTTWTRRSIHTVPRAEARAVRGAVFAKPPSGKEFPARVYAGGEDLPDVPGLVQLSEVVEFAEEYRLYVLDGAVHTGSRYATWGRLDPLPEVPARVLGFAEEFLAETAHTLPSAVVVDVGLVGPPGDPRRDVAVVEANMAWFAQPYLADPDRVLDVIRRAAGPVEEVTAEDRRFVRVCPGVKRMPSG